MKLVAGERRLRAMKKLHAEQRLFSCNDTMILPNEIPFIEISCDLSELEVREAELEENTIRVDLTWQERVAALDELHTLRTARNPEQTIQDTAVEVASKTNITPASAQRSIAEAHLIADYLDVPEVAAASSARRAHKIVTAKLEAELTAELAKRAKRTPAHTSNHTLHIGDFCSVELTKRYSCIIADPPYGIDADKFGNAASTSHTYSDTRTTALDFAKKLFELTIQTALPYAHLYLFCDIRMFFEFYDLAASHPELNPRPIPLIWHKTSMSAHAPSQNRGFKRQYETILFCSHGDKLFEIPPSDVFAVAPRAIKQMAAQKPTELYMKLLRLSTLPGDTVLDPCCGTGTIFEAAEALSLHATGIELSPTTAKFAEQTLYNLKQSKAPSNAE